jgi:putative ABC transport system ATP-binding protein
MLQLKNISKCYSTGDVETTAVADVSLSISQGEYVAIMGESGCGKSSLLNILGLLDAPTAGSLKLFDQEASCMSERERTQLRRSSIGFIFQSFNLIDDLNVASNIDVALIYRGVPSQERKRRVAEVIERVGLTHRARHFPAQLSGGQQQRVAVARALVSNPRLILADEPTGNLDSANGNTILELLNGVARSGTTVVMVTHSLEQAATADRIIKMRDGRVVSAELG